MLHTKFHEISLPVLEKKIFEGFLPYMGVVAASWSCDQHHVIRFSFPGT